MSAPNITIQIKMIKGQPFNLTVPANISIPALQERIANDHSIPIDRQRLIFGGKVLKPDKNLNDYGIEDGNSIHLIVKAEETAQPPNSTNTNTTASTSTSSTNSNAASAGAAPTITFHPLQQFTSPINGFPTAQMMMGTVDVSPSSNGTLPDLNALVNSVLTSIGVGQMGRNSSNSAGQAAAGMEVDNSNAASAPAPPPASATATATATYGAAPPQPIGVASTTPQPAAPLNTPSLSSSPPVVFSPAAPPFLPNQIGINALRDSFNAIPPAFPTRLRESNHSAGIITAPLEENINGLLSLLEQMQTLTSSLPRTLQALHSQLSTQRESEVSSSTRVLIQRNAHELAVYYRRVSIGLGNLARILTHLAPQTPTNNVSLAIAPMPVVPTGGPIEVEGGIRPGDLIIGNRNGAGQINMIPGGMLPVNMMQGNQQIPNGNPFAATPLAQQQVGVQPQVMHLQLGVPMQFQQPQAQIPQAAGVVGTGTAAQSQSSSAPSNASVGSTVPSSSSMQMSFGFPSPPLIMGPNGQRLPMTATFGPNGTVQWSTAIQAGINPTAPSASISATPFVSPPVQPNQQRQLALLQQQQVLLTQLQQVHNQLSIITQSGVTGSINAVPSSQGGISVASPPISSFFSSSASAAPPNINASAPAASPAADSSQVAQQPNPFAAMLQMFAPIAAQVTNQIAQSSTPEGGAQAMLNILGPIMQNVSQAVGGLQGQTPGQQGSQGQTQPQPQPHSQTSSSPLPSLSPSPSTSTSTSSQSLQSSTTQTHSLPQTGAATTAPTGGVNPLAAFFQQIQQQNSRLPSSAATVPAPTAPNQPPTTANPVPPPRPLYEATPVNLSINSSNSPMGVMTAAPVATPVTNPPSAPPNIMAMMESMFSQLGSGGNTSTGNPLSLSDVMRNVTRNNNSSQSSVDDEDDDGDGDGSIIDGFISRLMSTLTIPDLLSVLHGNLTPLDKTEDSVYDLIVGLMDEEDTESSRMGVAGALASTLASSLLSDQVVNSRREFMLNRDTDLIRLSTPLLTRRLRILIDQVLDRHDREEEEKKQLQQLTSATTSSTAPPSTSSTLPPFSAYLKIWGRSTIGQWFDLLSNQYTDNQSSVQRIVQTALQLKFSAIGPEFSFMLPMVSGTLTTSIMKTWQTYRQEGMTRKEEKNEETKSQQYPSSATYNSSSGIGSSSNNNNNNNNNNAVSSDREVWLQYVPPVERDVWHNTIARDVELLQSELKLEQERLRKEREEKEMSIEDEKEEKKLSSPDRSISSTLYQPLSSVYTSGRIPLSQEEIIQLKGATATPDSGSDRIVPSQENEGRKRRSPITAEEDTATSEEGKIGKFMKK